MKLPTHKTKIICTIGPVSSSVAVMKGMIENGMNVARLNGSHGDFDNHAAHILNIRTAASELGQVVSIIMDLPGVKMRIGRLPDQGIILKKDAKVVLTTRAMEGTSQIIPIEFKNLAQSVTKGKTIFLNDGFIQLKVESVRGADVHCKVLIGGKLLSHKGLNLPGAKLDINPITQKDLSIVEFGLTHGVNVFGLSFVERASDVIKVREFAKKLGYAIYLVAKIERREAIENFDEILKVADAVMIARGDLGVEVPIEEVPGIQKRLIQKANMMGRPVITATQMLESMTQNVRPTRAEVNDVANAILDGTDAIMLSQETAIGEYPIETVNMMAKIARTTELQRDGGQLSNEEGMQITYKIAESRSLTITDVTSLNAVRAAQGLNARYILTPTSSGSTARRISRFKPPCWILSFSANTLICNFLNFSYGVQPFLLDQAITHDPKAILKVLKEHRMIKSGDTVILTERRLSSIPGDTDTLGILKLG